MPDADISDLIRKYEEYIRKQTVIPYGLRLAQTFSRQNTAFRVQDVEKGFLVNYVYASTSKCSTKDRYYLFSYMTNTCYETPEGDSIQFECSGDKVSMQFYSTVNCQGSSSKISLNPSCSNGNDDDAAADDDPNVDDDTVSLAMDYKCYPGSAKLDGDYILTRMYSDDTCSTGDAVASGPRNQFCFSIPSSDPNGFTTYIKYDFPTVSMHFGAGCTGLLASSANVGAINGCKLRTGDDDWNEDPAQDDLDDDTVAGADDDVDDDSTGLVKNLPYIRHSVTNMLLLPGAQAPAVPLVFDTTMYFSFVSPEEYLSDKALHDTVFQTALAEILGLDLENIKILAVGEVVAALGVINGQSRDSDAAALRADAGLSEGSSTDGKERLQAGDEFQIKFRTTVEDFNALEYSSMREAFVVMRGILQTAAYSSSFSGTVQGAAIALGSDVLLDANVQNRIDVEEPVEAEDDSDTGLSSEAAVGIGVGVGGLALGMAIGLAVYCVFGRAKSVAPAGSS
eukprot:gene29849-36039_t